MRDSLFINGLRRELHRLGSRKMYIFGMVVVPLFVAVFFLSLLNEGLPERVPTAIVDLDHSSMSRSVGRSLRALQLLDVCREAESYDKALEQIRSGETFGFFVIPANFEKDALGGNTPTLEYYTNMTYFVPGTLSFKGFKTVAVATAAWRGEVHARQYGRGPSEDKLACAAGGNRPVSAQQPVDELRHLSGPVVHHGHLRPDDNAYDGVFHHF